MANDNTGLEPLIPDLYESLDIVSRELTGFTLSVTLDANAAQAAVGQQVIIPVTQAQTSTDIVPGNDPPQNGGQTFDEVTLTITKAKQVPFAWKGEDQKGVSSGPGYRNIRRDQITQAMRALVNELEIDLATTHYQASRATGTAGTTPFASDLSDPAQVLKVLIDNGAPRTDLQLVIDTTAGANLRSLGQLNKANEAGTTALREQGVLLGIHGFDIRESAGIQPVSAVGTGANFQLNGAHAKGATTINVDTGSGTILQGDIVTIAGNKYVVATALNGGSFTINKPGLVKAAADNTAVTVGAIYTPNFAFARSAIILATRAPARPQEGDEASDVMIVTDPKSGLSFEVAMYKKYRMVRYEVSLAWGYKLIKPEHVALLLG